MGEGYRPGRERPTEVLRAPLLLGKRIFSFLNLCQLSGRETASQFLFSALSLLAGRLIFSELLATRCSSPFKLCTPPPPGRPSLLTRARLPALRWFNSSDGLPLPPAFRVALWEGWSVCFSTRKGRFFNVAKSSSPFLCGFSNRKRQGPGLLWVCEADPH